MENAAASFAFRKYLGYQLCQISGTLGSQAQNLDVGVTVTLQHTLQQHFESSHGTIGQSRLFQQGFHIRRIE
jgi:hypothetical protein